MQCVLCIQHTVDYITHCTMHCKRGRDSDLSGALPALKIDPRDIRRSFGTVVFMFWVLVTELVLTSFGAEQEEDAVDKSAYIV